jgi:ABC-type multidrug transport system ATPase subunit
LCIGIGETFGLLGQNGAGKSTTVRMMSGSEEPTRGDVIVAGRDMVAQRQLAQRSIGLCPQFGASAVSCLVNLCQRMPCVSSSTH